MYNKSSMQARNSKRMLLEQQGVISQFELESNIIFLKSESGRQYIYPQSHRRDLMPTIKQNKSGIISYELKYLRPNIRIIKFTISQIKIKSLPDLSAFNSQKVAFQMCSIDEIYDFASGNYPALIQLDLFKNNIKGCLPLIKAPKLTNLNVKENRLNSMKSQKTLHNHQLTGQLDTCQGSDHNLGPKLPKAHCNLLKCLHSGVYHNLIKLNLNSNSLSSVEFLNFLDLQHLKELSLQSNLLVQAKSIRKMYIPSIQSCSLKENPIVGERFDSKKLEKIIKVQPRRQINDLSLRIQHNIGLDSMKIMYSNFGVKNIWTGQRIINRFIGFDMY